MPFIIPAITGTLKTIIIASCTERVIMYTALEILKYLASKSTNEIDDKIVLKIEAAIKAKEKV